MAVVTDDEMYQFIATTVSATLQQSVQFPVDSPLQAHFI